MAHPDPLSVNRRVSDPRRRHRRHGVSGSLRRSPPVGARSDRSRSMSCPRIVRAGRWAEAAVRSRRRWQPMKGPAAGPHPRRALRCNARPLRPLFHRDFKSAFVPKRRRLRQLVPPAARRTLKTGVWNPDPNPPSPQIGAISGPGPPPARSAAPSRRSRPSAGLIRRDESAPAAIRARRRYARRHSAPFPERGKPRKFPVLATRSTSGTARPPSAPVTCSDSRQPRSAPSTDPHLTQPPQDPVACQPPAPTRVLAAGESGGGAQRVRAAKQFFPRGKRSIVDAPVLSKARHGVP